MVPYVKYFETDWKVAEDIDTLNALRETAKITWLVYTLPFHLEAAFPDLITTIRREFPVVKQFHGTLNGGTVFVCRSGRDHS